MKLLKIVIILFFCLFGIYAISMIFVDESKSFEYESEIQYPIEKVFPQFNNLQNFASWSGYFINMSGFSFFMPYEGKNSSMKFWGDKDKTSGELFIRYSNENKSIRYQLFEVDEENPYLIDIRFIPNSNSTKVIWTVHTPKREFLERSLNLIAEEEFVANIDVSLKKLNSLLGNKIDKEEKLASVKYDSLMVENYQGNLLLGVNVNTKNTKDGLYKNVMINYGKVINYVTNDLKRKEDEFGIPVLLSNTSSLKDKEISYFLGVPLPKRVSVSDNNFNFQTVNGSKVYVMYYKGTYNNRIKNIQTLLQRAKKDTMRNGLLMEEFLEEPVANQDVKLKLSLPVFR